MGGLYLSSVVMLAAMATACTSNAESARPPTTPLTFPETVAEPTRLDDELALEALMPVVAGLRDLEFLEPVEVRLIDGAEYLARVEELTLGSRTMVSGDAYAWFPLLGLVEDGTDVDALTARLLASTVAFYDATGGQILVQAPAGIDPYIESVVVHEMVHALHDQHFGPVPPPEQVDDAAYVATALREGDARRIERRFIGRITGAAEFDYEQGRLRAAEEVLPNPDAPRYVLQRLTQPLADGLAFADRISNDEADAVILDPPPTSEHLLHPERAELPRDSRLDKLELPDYRALSAQTFGEAQLRLLLTQAVGDVTAGVAAYGWGGDSLQVYVLDDEVVFSYVFVGDSVGDAEELATAFRLFLDRQLAADRFGLVRIEGEEVIVVAASDLDAGAVVAAQLEPFGVEVFSEPG